MNGPDMGLRGHTLSQRGKTELTGKKKKKKSHNSLYLHFITV